MTSNQSIYEQDINSVLHPYTNLSYYKTTGPMIIDRADGIYVWDKDGKIYIEAMGGLWCTSLGFNNKELIEAAKEQMSRLSFAHLFGGKSHDGAILLSEKLKALLPVSASKIFFTSSGSEANDTQIKLLWFYNNVIGKPEKKKIISRHKAYHGVTLATASLTGLAANHDYFDLPLERILHTDCPHYYRFAEGDETEAQFTDRILQSLESLILKEGPETIAAFFAEPVMGAGGVIVPPSQYFAKLQALLQEYDIQLIVDEVICGFGRTGQWFGCHSFDIQPDSISVAKALTSAYAPLGALSVSEPIYQAIENVSKDQGTFGHGYTYSGHPLSTALALKTLEIYERENIVGHVQEVSKTFLQNVQNLQDHPLIGEARGIGLLAGLELVANKKTKASFEPKMRVGLKASEFCQQQGVILRPLGDTLAICPPLIIQDEQVVALFDALKKGLDLTLEWVHKEKLI